MDSFIKISANQASFDVGTGAAKRNVDIDIPAGGVYDLSKSYVNVKLETIGTNADIAAAVANVQNTLGNGTGGEVALHYPNTAALVKNAQMISNSKGGLESIRDVQTLRNAQAAYNRNIAEQNDDKGKLAHFEANNLYHIHPQNEINKVGNELSVQKDHDIKIPLKDIFNFADVAEAYDTSNSAYGQTRIHLELNSDRLGNLEDSNDDFGNKTTDNKAAGTNIQAIDELDNAANAGATVIDTVITTAAYPNLDNIPFFVGQGIRFTFTSSNVSAPSGAGKTHDCQITAIERAKTDTTGGLPAANLGANVLAITFTPALPAIEGTKKFGPIVVAPTASNVLSNQVIKSVELVAYSNRSDKPPANYTYTTYMSEADSYPAQNTASRLYTIPAGCKNLYVMFGNSSVGARSADNHLRSYRMAIDNKELTPRPVRLGSGLHYDLLNQVYKNNGGSIHSYLEKSFLAFAGNSRTTGGAGTFDQYMIACPVPFKAQPQQFQLDLEADTGQVLNGNLIVYFEVVKQK